MNMLQVEILRFNWSALPCGCHRTADHIPRDFLVSLSEEVPSDDAGATWADNHAYIQSNLMAPAVATASMVMSALAVGVPVHHRCNLLEVLQSLACGEQDAVAAQCLDVIRGGKWLLYEEITSGRSMDAAVYSHEIIALMEEEAERLQYVRTAAQGKLPSYLLNENYESHP
ncbi:hypothetical protein [Streptomyces qinglanensis]|uniref:hypothetical protein n=1 Tax=Streptomyces qinglanensis TaxID=943816 RepID=UPI00116057D4|nr:hypothetical protein [Streptomyces qinglanensis]